MDDTFLEAVDPLLTCSALRFIVSYFSNKRFFEIYKKNSKLSSIFSFNLKHKMTAAMDDSFLSFIQGDKINIAMCFWYPVKSDLNSVH